MKETEWQQWGGSPKAEGSREAAEEPQLISSVCVTRRPNQTARV